MQDLAQLNRLCAYDYPIEKIRLDNTGDSTYHQTFHDYCMSIEMDIEHLIAHVHVQNGLVKSLLMRTNMLYCM